MRTNQCTKYTQCSLNALLDILDQLAGNIIGSCFKITFCNDPDNGFSIACSQMHPVIVKLDAESIDGIQRIRFVFLLNFGEYAWQINSIFQLNFIFADEIIRIAVPQLLGSFL